MGGHDRFKRTTSTALGRPLTQYPTHFSMMIPYRKIWVCCVLLTLCLPALIAPAFASATARMMEITGTIHAIRYSDALIKPRIILAELEILDWREEVWVISLSTNTRIWTFDRLPAQLIVLNKKQKVKVTFIETQDGDWVADQIFIESRL